MPICKQPLLAAAPLLVTMFLSAGCQQTPLNCSSFHGYFASTYELTSGDAASTCGSIPGDVLGLNTYFGNRNQAPNLDQGTLAIRPQYLNDLIFRAAGQGVVDETMNDAAQALGDFTAARPGADDFCEAPRFEPTQLSLPEIPEVLDDPETPDVDESVPVQPATTITYDWSNARVLVNANAQGTQFSADLHYVQDGCEADYHVVGMYPAVGCESNADCDDESNGINFDFAVECSTTLGLCVLTEEPPAYE